MKSWRETVGGAKLIPVKRPVEGGVVMLKQQPEVSLTGLTLGLVLH